MPEPCICSTQAAYTFTPVMYMLTLFGKEKHHWLGFPCNFDNTNLSIFWGAQALGPKLMNIYTALCEYTLDNM